MALSVAGSNAGAAVLARVEQQSRQQEEAQRANRERLAADAAKARQAAEQQPKEAQAPAPVANERGQSTGGTVNTTA